MDPLNPFANAWDDDNKTSHNDSNDAAWTPAADTSVTGTHDNALPSWSNPAAASYDQDTTTNHVDSYAPESSDWQPASPVWQASSLPVFDKEESDNRQLDEEAIPLPSPTRLTNVTEPATEDNDDWGQMALPKSRWEEELHKPPVWESDAKEEPEIQPIGLAPSTSRLDAAGEWPNQELGNEDDPWGAKTHTSTSNKHGDDDNDESATAYNGDTSQDKPVIDSRYHGGTPPESPSTSSLAERDFAPVKSSDIEKRKAAKGAVKASQSSNTSEEDEDALRVLAELGVSVRNLDQEGDAAKAPAANPGRWSLFGGRKIAPTAAQLESSRASIEAGAGQAAAKVSASMDVIREKAASVSLPRLSSSSSAAAASPADPSSRTATPPLTPGEKSDAPTFAQKESKWFRFGAKKPAVTSPTTSETRPASAGSNNPPPSSISTTASTAAKAPIDILDDFGQLENFDSRLSAPTGPSTALSKNSGQTSRYDASSSLSSYHRDDLVADKPSWSFWSGRAPSASHSALGKNGIVEHANDGEAELDNIFEAFEAAPKKTASDSAKKGDDLLFDGSSQRSRQVAPDLAGLDDPYSVLGVGSSRTAPSKRASAAKDLDPLDPLSAFVSSPPTKPVSRIPSGPISPLAPPPLSSSTSRSQSANSVVKPLAPPPRLAPPPPSAGLRRTPSPSSLLDDFGDFAVSPTASSSTTPQPSNQAQPAQNKPNDDFGDFEAFAVSASVPSTAAAPVTASPKKAAGPMKLVPPKAIIPSGASGSLSQQDLSFFDSL